MRNIDLTTYHGPDIEECYYKRKLKHKLFFKNPFLYMILVICDILNIKLSIKPSEFTFAFDFIKYGYKLDISNGNCLAKHGFSSYNFRWCHKIEVSEWLLKNLKEVCIVHVYALQPIGEIYFSNKEDYMLFKLTWC